METLKHKLNIQLFAEDKGAEDVLTFDEILSDKVYQAEFDRRVQKAIDKVTEKLSKQHQDELENLKKSAQLSEEQASEFQKLQAKYQAETEAFQQQIQEKDRLYAFDLAIAKSGVIDSVALKAHMQNFVKDAEFKDGKIQGLDEEITKRLADDLKHLSPTKKATGGAIENPPKDKTVEEIIRQGFGLK